MTTPTGPGTTDGDAPAVPDELVLVRSFANTLDVEDGTDRFRDGHAMATWLREQELPGGDDGPVGDDDLELARRLRAALRAALLDHHGRPHDDLDQLDDLDGPGGEGAAPAAPPAPWLLELDALAAELPLRASFAGGAPGLAGHGDGVRRALALVLARVVEAAAHGRWERLKLCPADACAWAFYDQSRNRSRRWCSMDVCGNRTKTRTYRARRRS